MKREKTKRARVKKKDSKKGNAPSVLIVETEPNSRSLIESTLKEINAFGELMFSANMEEGFQRVKANAPDLLILGEDDNPERALSFIERIAVSCPHMMVFFSAYGEDSNLLIRAMRAGVREFLKRPIEQNDLSASCNRFLSTRALHGLSSNRIGKVISVYGVKGGLGTTTIVTNLAINLSRAVGRSVVLLDANFYSGSVCIFLDMQPKLSIADLLRDIDQVEPNSLKKVLPKHATGVYFLAPPKGTNGALMISDNDLSRIFPLLRLDFDYTVIDLDRYLDTTTAGILEETDLLLLVVNLDIPSLVNTNRVLEMLQRLGFDSEKVMIVSNRHSAKHEFMLDEFEQITKKSVDCKIPNFKYPVCLKAVNRGEPVALKAERSKINQSIIKLARSIENRFNRSGE